MIYNWLYLLSVDYLVGLGNFYFHIIQTMRMSGVHLLDISQRLFFPYRREIILFTCRSSCEYIETHSNISFYYISYLPIQVIIFSLNSLIQVTCFFLFVHIFIQSYPRSIRSYNNTIHTFALVLIILSNGSTKEEYYRRRHLFS